MIFYHPINNELFPILAKCDLYVAPGMAAIMSATRYHIVLLLVMRNGNLRHPCRTQSAKTTPLLMR